jgi:thiol-disulfide isomerase/thioredoxin
MPAAVARLPQGMSGTGAVVLVAALVVCAGVAWWSRSRDGRLRVPSAEEASVPSSDVDAPQRSTVFDELGVRPGDADLTVVQFSTAFCGPCRSTRARLTQLASTHPGLSYVHVDAESHLDAVRELDVRRTPTLFWLDRSGAVLGRSSGAPRPAELTALVEAHTGAAT